MHLGIPAAQRSHVSGSALAMSYAMNRMGRSGGSNQMMRDAINRSRFRLQVVADSDPGCQQ
jgi:hypothetical protein